MKILLVIAVIVMCMLIPELGRVLWGVILTFGAILLLSKTHK